MRIDELANPSDTKLPYDIVDDLHVFMRNDPMFYRRDYYPTMCEMGNYVGKKQKIKVKEMLGPLIDKGVNQYCEKYKLAKYPQEVFTLEDRIRLIQKIVDEEMPNIRNGEYK